MSHNVQQETKLLAANNENVEKHSLGNKECSAYKSLHFADEYKSKSNTYDSCCSHGKFVEDKFNHFPLILKELFMRERESPKLKYRQLFPVVKDSSYAYAVKYVSKCKFR